MPRIRDFNLFLLFTPFLIFSLGFMTLLSVAPGKAKASAVFLLVAGLAYFLAALVDYHIYVYISKHIYVLSLVLLLATYVVGHVMHGASRWLNVGGLTFQPSELTKVALVMFLCSFLVSSCENINSWKTLVKIVLSVAPVFVLVALQPDLGTSLVLLFTVVIVLVCFGLKKSFLVLMFVSAGLLSSPLWNALKEYQQDRILVFLNPAADPLGSGYNVIQSLIAVGSGGIFGKGFYHGTQTHLNFLPAYWTDFIFASFAEEWGFVGVVLLLILYLALLFSLITVYYRSRDVLGSLLVAGVYAIFFAQFVINIGMNLGLMPVTGIPLPLMSYGGTSLVVSMFLLGLVQNVWMSKRV